MPQNHPARLPNIEMPGKYQPRRSLTLEPPTIKVLNTVENKVCAANYPRFTCDKQRVISLRAGMVENLALYRRCRYEKAVGGDTKWDGKQGVDASVDGG